MRLAVALALVALTCAWIWLTLTPCGPRSLGIEVGHMLVAGCK